MRRRVFLSGLVALAGCTSASSVSDPQRTTTERSALRVTEWRDGENSWGVRYSAVYVVAEGSPPAPDRWRGYYQDGTESVASTPANPERYTDLEDFYAPEGDPRTWPDRLEGWLLFHPNGSDADEPRLVSVDVLLDGAKQSWDRPTD